MASPLHARVRVFKVPQGRFEGRACQPSIGARRVAGGVGPPLVSLAAPYALGETLLGGQAFRWRASGTSYEGFIENAPTRLTPSQGGVLVESAGEGDPVANAERYLRTSDDLAPVYRSIGKDERIRGALLRWRGLHLLAQDPWETLIAFTASSASNVSKISRSLEKVAGAYGEPVTLRGKTWHRFPTPGRLAKADLAGLRRCELGYRARYILSTARRLADGEVDLGAIAKMETPKAQAALVEAFDGTGPKVAACVLLFAMGKDDAFPVDRWVQRSVSEWYFGGETLTHRRCEEWGRAYFGRHAGYAQQYLFHERRSRGREGSARPPC